MAIKLKLSDKAITLVSNPDFIKSLSNHIGENEDTVKEWVDENSEMLLLHKCYSFIQSELYLTDKDLFTVR